MRSAVNSTDSARETRDVRLEEAPEARLGGLLPGSLLIQWSQRDELVEPDPGRETTNPQLSLSPNALRGAILFDRHSAHSIHMQRSLNSHAAFSCKVFLCLGHRLKWKLHFNVT